MAGRVASSVVRPDLALAGASVTTAATARPASQFQYPASYGGKPTPMRLLTGRSGREPRESGVTR